MGLPFISISIDWQNMANSTMVILDIYIRFDKNGIWVYLNYFLQDWGKEMLGPVWWIMPAAVLFSTFGAANGLCFSSGRFVQITLLVYAMHGTRGEGQRLWIPFKKHLLKESFDQSLLHIKWKWVSDSDFIWQHCMCIWLHYKYSICWQFVLFVSNKNTYF